MKSDRGHLHSLPHSMTNQMMTWTSQAGEYYIDSLAVLPEYRRRGIARQLMQAQIEQGRQLGFTHFTLLVDPVNPNAQGLYSQLGFQYESDCYAFGQKFWKWGMNL